MDRKRKKLSLGKNGVQTQCQEVTLLRQKLINMEAELNMKNEEKDNLVKRVTSLEQELAKKETQLILNNTEKMDLCKRVATLEQELSEKEDLRKRVAALEQELAEKVDLCKQVTTLKQELAEKEDLLKQVTSLEQQLSMKEDQLKRLKILCDDSTIDDSDSDNSASDESVNDVSSKYDTVNKDSFKYDTVNDDSSNDELLDIDALPNEMILKIFEHLTQNELGQIASVCKRWYHLTKNPVLWKKVNVEFHWSHNTQNDILISFINKLPCCIVSIEVDFVKADNWIEPLDFHEFCVTLQEKHPDLEKLILYKSQLVNTYPSVIHLCSHFLPKLTTLILRFPDVLDSPARVEGGVTSEIEVLEVTGQIINHFSDTLFSKMSKLKQLYLSHCMDDTWIERIFSFFNCLEVFQLAASFIGYISFQAIKNHGQNLKELYLCFSHLHDDDLKFNTSRFPRLKTVCLNQCNDITSEGVVSLVKSCPSLQNIYVNRRVALSYGKHPFFIANRLDIVKTFNCYEHMRRGC